MGYVSVLSKRKGGIAKNEILSLIGFAYWFKAYEPGNAGRPAIYFKADCSDCGKGEAGCSRDCGGYLRQGNSPGGGGMRFMAQRNMRAHISGADEAEYRNRENDRIWKKSKYP